MGKNVIVPPDFQSYNVVETTTFELGVKRLGNHQRLEGALEIVKRTASNNPTVFNVVEGMKDIRLAKLDQVDNIPPLRIWLKINDESRSVVFLDILPMGTGNGV